MGPSIFSEVLDSIMRGYLGGIDIRTKTRCWNDSGGGAVITVDPKADLSQLMEFQTLIAQRGKRLYAKHRSLN